MKNFRKILKNINSPSRRKSITRFKRIRDNDVMGSSWANQSSKKLLVIVGKVKPKIKQNARKTISNTV